MGLFPYQLTLGFLPWILVYASYDMAEPMWFLQCPFFYTDYYLEEYQLHYANLLEYSME